MAERKEAVLHLSVAEVTAAFCRRTERGWEQVIPGDVGISHGCRMDCLCLRVDERHRERDCSENRKVTKNVTFPSFSEAKMNPFLPRSPELTGVSVKDSWLSVQPVSTYLPPGSSSAVLLSACWLETLPRALTPN